MKTKHKDLLWDDDDYSEFAETLAAACEGRNDVGVRNADMCPLGALVSSLLLAWSSLGKYEAPRRPGAVDASMVLGIPYKISVGFIRGFEGCAWSEQGEDERAYALGVMFREEYSR